MSGPQKNRTRQTEARVAAEMAPIPKPHQRPGKLEVFREGFYFGYLAALKRRDWEPLAQETDQVEASQ